MFTKHAQCLLLTALLSGALLFPQIVSADDPGYSLDNVDVGFLADPKVRFQDHGDYAGFTGTFTLDPGAAIEWHTNTGLYFFVGTGGTVAEYDRNGCVHHYGPGSVLIESSGGVHRIVNESGTTPYTAKAFGLLPIADLLSGNFVTPVPQPASSLTPCGPDNGGGE